MKGDEVSRQEIKQENRHAHGCLLHELLVNVAPYRHGESQKNLLITAITADSRTVESGSLFVALKGEKTDGHRYISQAIQRGAAAIIVDESSSHLDKYQSTRLPIIGVQDTSETLGIVAAKFYENPAERLMMVGITGTNGKTTVSYLMEHVLLEAGFQTGVIGTVNYRYRAADGSMVELPAPFTTPDPVQLHATLREMLDNGVSHVIMEVSSHALKQRRLGRLEFSLAVFTNLSQDHLDYHKTMADYFEAKCMLFDHHLIDGAVVVVMESSSGDAEKQSWVNRLIEFCRSRDLRVIPCGTSSEARYTYIGSTLELSGMSVVFLDDSGTQRILRSPLVGQFNVENLLASLAALVTLGIETDMVCESLTDAPGAPGRLERVRIHNLSHSNPTVLVDYAHTPDALENVLKTARQLPHQTLFCVFGCGGDRDQGKRPLMGRVAAELADVAIVTDDNPRSENPAEIRSQIKRGAELTGKQARTKKWLRQRRVDQKGFVEIGERAEAIKEAVSSAGAEDIVLIAGKGHETYQITQSGRRFFDDRLAAQESSLIWNVDILAEACGGVIISRGSTPFFTSISTDSRTIKNGEVFVALSGENFDGHDYLQTAVENGARCLLISDKERGLEYEVACVVVEDTITALGDLAHWRRQAVRKMSDPLVVGITGSCGKTTVKEMTAAILSRNWPDQPDQPMGQVLKTVGNFNNLFGLPLSLLPVSPKHRGVVLELGMNMPGEIARLTEIADPDIACILNIHGVHLEGLGSIEGVAEAKEELFSTTSKDALHIINLDDERVVNCGMHHTQKKVRYAATDRGLAQNPDIWAESIDVDDRGHLSFILHVKEQQSRLKIHAPGLHNSSNACAAAAIAYAGGIDFDIIIRGLEDFRSPANRMETLKSPLGLNILNDTYNANPASMASGLKTFVQLPAVKRLAILGDMLELGEASGELHEDLGRLAASLGIDFLGVTGDFSENIKDGALSGGFEAARIVVFDHKERVVDWVAELVHSDRLQSGDWVLVKASRGLALDTIVKQLLEIC